jgi:hypothetical protein
MTICSVEYLFSFSGRQFKFIKFNNDYRHINIILLTKIYLVLIFVETIFKNKNTVT